MLEPLFAKLLAAIIQRNDEGGLGEAFDQALERLRLEIFADF